MLFMYLLNVLIIIVKESSFLVCPTPYYPLFFGNFYGRRCEFPSERRANGLCRRLSLSGSRLQTQTLPSACRQTKNGFQVNSFSRVS